MTIFESNLRENGVSRTALQVVLSRRELGIVRLVALAAYPAFFAGQLTQSLPVLGLSSGFVAVWLGCSLRPRP